MSTTEHLPDEWLLEHFDYYCPDLAPSMPESLARMRELCPVAHSDALDGYWILTKYEDVRAAAQDWSAFTSTAGLAIVDPPAPPPVRIVPESVDPPEQRIFKRLITPYFTPAAVAAWEGPLRELVTKLIDAFIEDGETEFMTAFARPFPNRAFFEHAISAPKEDLDKVAQLAARASAPMDPKAGENWFALYTWIKGFIEQRRATAPRADVVDGLLRAEVDGQPLDESDIIGAVILLILGGLETTAGALGLIMIRLCRQPEIAERLRRHPASIPKAVEELLRLDSSFICIGRTATRDVEIGGNEIKAGDKVLLHWASANRDDDKFANGSDVDLDRTHNPHLAFGVGPHRCAGSNIARLNLRVALEEIVARLPDLRLREGAEIRYHSASTRSPLSLPITFTPGRRSTP
jgi:cytochrome P450